MVKRLEELKVGDKVFVCGRFYKALSEVEKITPAGFIKVDGILYDKHRSQRGGGINGLIIIKATDSAIEEFKREVFTNNTLRELHSLKEISYEQAVKIRDILNPVIKQG